MTFSRTATFEFAVSVPFGSLRCTLDTGFTAPCTSPRTINNLSEGYHSFSVYSVDRESVQDLTPATYDWANVVVSAGDNLSGVASVTFGANGAPLPASAVTHDPAGGSWTVEFQATATDGAGNSATAFVWGHGVPARPQALGVAP